jgi:hypothetical protein
LASRQTGARSCSEEHLAAKDESVVSTDVRVIDLGTRAIVTLDLDLQTDPVWFDPMCVTSD